MDYKKLGFKAGIECHQQLETNKLFCKCPSIVHDKEPTIFFERKLRASAGETGKVDKAAKVEMQKDILHKYQACTTSSCLVEYDEEPPHAPNQHAIDIALEISLLFNATPVDDLHFMRKTVVDGSNVSGFQRTALIGTDGYVDTSKGRVSIPIILLEEEAAKKIKTEKHCITWRLDRLGVCLVEISTGPDIKDPEHAKETAERIGMILRSTGKVKRGIGTIRQDVNVSIKGHPRVEIKGFQELKIMPKVIEIEIKRQQKTPDKASNVRKFNPDGTSTFMRPMPGASRMYPETDIAIIPITKERLQSIKLPELIDEKTLRLEKELKLRTDLTKAVIKANLNLDIFKLKLDNNLIAEIILNYPKEIKKRFNLESNLQYKDFKEILTLLLENKIPKSAVQDVMIKKIKGHKINLKSYEGIDAKDLEKYLKQLVKKNPNTPIGGLMGDAMKHFKGKADGKLVMQILKKLK
jgi:Glu-tRNA(Gln) amidotransferase subunit E-like FAD-binding protein